MAADLVRACGAVAGPIAHLVTGDAGRVVVGAGPAFRARGHFALEVAPHLIFAVRAVGDAVAHVPPVDTLTIVAEPPLRPIRSGALVPAAHLVGAVGAVFVAVARHGLCDALLVARALHSGAPKRQDTLEAAALLVAVIVSPAVIVPIAQLLASDALVGAWASGRISPEQELAPEVASLLV